jgi:DNA ligase-associated metallophosphoesterase
MIPAEQLQQRLVNNQVIPVKFAGHQLLLDATGVLIWPAQDLIVFSDLHLEKGSFLSQFANPLPRFDSKDTLARMAQAIAIYDCQNVLCLGDSLHDANAISRMQIDDLSALNTMIGTRNSWIWILGNHDPEIPKDVLGTRKAYQQIHNVLLVHEPEDLSDFVGIDTQIIGHFHPKLSHKLTSRKVTGKCFVCATDLLLMPAYGKYTGGLDLADQAFNTLLGASEQCDYCVYLLYQTKIYML